MRSVVRGARGGRAARSAATGAVLLAVLAAAAFARGARGARAADPAPSASPVAAAHLAIDPTVLSAQPEPIARALRANVVIERDAGVGRPATVAAGVILGIHDGTATIATAQHVVDPRFTGGVRVPSKPETLPTITVVGSGGVRVRAKVEWLAPHGVDLAIVSARLPDPEARAAVRADDAPLPQAGDPVFTIGNPQGAGWTRADGSVKQHREARQDGFAYTMLWSAVVVQPGFSGGGLYDAQGRLVAINSTRGGISAGPRGALLLSTPLRALVALAPAELRRGDG